MRTIMLAMAALLAGATSVSAIERGLGSKFYSDSNEVAFLMACHPRDQAFTIGGGGSYGLGGFAWTLRVGVGDSVLLKSASGLIKVTLQSMKDCVGSFDEIRQ